MKTYYHITPVKNISKIKEKGLIPRIGKRSKLCKETIPRIYTFSTKEDMEDALCNWFGSLFSDDTDLMIIKINTDIEPEKQLDPKYEYECCFTKPIPPENLTIYSENQIDTIP